MILLTKGNPIRQIKAPIDLLAPKRIDTTLLMPYNQIPGNEAFNRRAFQHAIQMAIKAKTSYHGSKSNIKMELIAKIRCFVL